MRPAKAPGTSAGGDVADDGIRLVTEDVELGADVHARFTAQ